MKTKFFLNFILLFIFLISCKQAEEKPNTSRPALIIDSHIHYGASDEWEKSFIDIYTRHNAMGCVLVGMKHLERGIEFAKKHPDRVIPYAAIDIDSPTVTDDIRKVKAMGFRGLGELFATDEGPEGLESNIIRFNKMLDACNVPEETRAKMYGLTIAKIHGIDVK